ncbi:rhamnulokinase [Halanaerocella petrolearia]
MRISCLAVDIGASSGRLIEGNLDNNKINLKEMHRFKNQIIEKEDRKGNKHYCWELDKLYNQILVGIKKSKTNNTKPMSIGIDTWGVDFVLLDSKGDVLGNTVSYRSHRTDGLMEDFFNLLPKSEIYKRTGIQFLQFNTLYQLYALKKLDSKLLESAETLLLIPDYFNYLLTGNKTTEYTNVTTTQLFNVTENKWDEKLLSELEIGKELFNNPIEPGTVIGELKEEIDINLNDLKVIAPATHDTGSSIVAVPATSVNYAYISSGTWSLMGVETNEPICTETALEYNFTNEGGAYDTNRFLKNIMGLWLIQEVKKELNDKYDFDELVELAKAEESFKFLINPNDNRFLNPDSMIETIQNYCEESGQGIPTTAGELARCIFESLAFQYRQVLEELKETTSKSIDKINIIGGGVQNEFLNQLTANATGLVVEAGPIESTAIGNLLVQFMSLGYIDSLAEAREIVRNSFEIKSYSPQGSQKNIESFWDKFIELQN